MKLGKNESYKRRFTLILNELVGEKKIDLQTALLLMSKTEGGNNKTVTKTSGFLYDCLQSGYTFSYALKVCTSIDFDESYIAFVRFAERSGSLEKAVHFLTQRCNRENENRMKIIEAMIYPVFVIFITLVTGVLLNIYSRKINLAVEGNVFGAEISLFDFIVPFFTAVVICIGLFIFIKNLLGTNKIYEAFLTMDYLIQGGESFADAAGSAANIVGNKTKLGKRFLDAGINLSYGMSLKDSFCIEIFPLSLRKEMDKAFFYAEKTSGKNQIFSRLAEWLGKRDEKKRIFILKLIEPFFICGTGIFLLLYLMNTLMPLLFMDNSIL